LAFVTDGGIRVTGPSGSLEANKSSGAVTSCGTIDAYYYENPTLAFSSIAVLVDVFKMHDDALWTSSAAFTVDVACSSTSVRLFVGTFDPDNTFGSNYTLHDTGSVAVVAGSVACGFSSAKTWTVTVYDDGSTSIA
jgi:hypothetical protein